MITKTKAAYHVIKKKEKRLPTLELAQPPCLAVVWVEMHRPVLLDTIIKQNDTELRKLVFIEMVKKLS